MIEFEDLDITGCDVDCDRLMVNVSTERFAGVVRSTIIINRAEIIQICQKMNITVSELLGDSPE